jgi:hypothetical protein
MHGADLSRRSSATLSLQERARGESDTSLGVRLGKLSRGSGVLHALDIGRHFPHWSLSSLCSPSQKGKGSGVRSAMHGTDLSRRSSATLSLQERVRGESDTSLGVRLGKLSRGSGVLHALDIGRHFPHWSLSSLCSRSQKGKGLGVRSACDPLPPLILFAVLI